MNIIITVIGKDKPGILYHVSKIVYEKGMNIEDVSQTIMQEYFTMLMMVKYDPQKVTIREIQESFSPLEKDSELSIHIQKTEIFDVMHKV